MRFQLQIKVIFLSFWVSKRAKRLTTRKYIWRVPTIIYDIGTMTIHTYSYMHTWHDYCDRLFKPYNTYYDNTVSTTYFSTSFALKNTQTRPNLKSEQTEARKLSCSFCEVFKNATSFGRPLAVGWIFHILPNT